MAGEIVVGYDGPGRRGGGPHHRGAGSPARVRPAVGDRVRVPALGPSAATSTNLAQAVREVGERMGRGGAHAGVHAPRRPRSTPQLELVDDRPAEALLRAADEHDALAIVVGTTGPAAPIAGSILGSVTYQVVHRSTRPVGGGTGLLRRN